MTYTFQAVDPPIATTAGVLYGINDAGEVVGFYGSTGGSDPGIGFNGTPPYVASTSFNITLDDYGYTSSLEGAVNNLGTVVGRLIDYTGNSVGYVYNPTLAFGEQLTLVTDPQTPPAETEAGTAYNELLGINDYGMAVGDRYERSTNTTYGYLYDSLTGVVTPFTLAGGIDVVPTGINDAGTICGSEVVAGVTIGFIDQGGVVTQLTGPAGATNTQAYALNNNGQVVGQYTDAGGTTHGFVYDVATATYTTVDDPNAVGGFTQIDGINDQGQIVGEYGTGGYVYGFLGTIQGGFETVGDPLAGTTVAVGAGSAGLSVGGSNAVTLLDAGYGDMTMFGNSGNDTFVLQADSGAGGDMWIGGAGNNSFFDMSAGYATETPTATIFLGDGANTVVSDGEAQVVASGGDDTLYDPRFAFGGGAGSSMLVSSITGATEVVGGAGTLTVLFGAYGAFSADGAVAFGGTGQGTFVGAGDDTFVVGEGPSTVYTG